ncbi:ATP-grasp domain-containing protein [Pseudochryseolinea flava]|uniref:Prokaryotic glutathione synthetase ATP-binding domain-containing protein n=1 Tax=Pseudochryseolinea flava TaxID=2059302 RepID=A0A364Y5N8_9BACT|nr:hypothetical protein [Pseudochryseolinea flava]RAW02308.1 hypothetical protein DQQ10_07175 [Pseudochryseolinea flava]
MRKIALLTCQRLSNLFETDQTLIPLFADKGFQAQPAIWNDPTIDWRTFEALVIRNTWDYYTQHDQFVAWLHKMRDNHIKLLNPPDVVLWNLHKFYLKTFQQQGVAIIDTLFSSAIAPVMLKEIVARGWENIVIKPAISAGSYLTKTFQVSDMSENTLSDIVKDGDWLIQPFIPEIEVQGELSMIFFNDTFSHAVVKVPKAGDFRVQRQYGGHYKLVDPGVSLIDMAEKIIACVGEPLLYARVDGVVIRGVFHLMELELIEPDLYFEFGIDIKKRFVNAVTDSLDR